MAGLENTRLPLPSEIERWAELDLFGCSLLLVVLTFNWPVFQIRLTGALKSNKF